MLSITLLGMLKDSESIQMLTAIDSYSMAVLLPNVHISRGLI